MRVVMLSLIVLTVVASPLSGAERVTGNYVEARTCQVYTGPCFANGEVGSAGKNAIMTWQIRAGRFEEADLAGQSVAVIVRTSHTLGFRGLKDAASKRAVVIIDSGADAVKASALRKFVLLQTGLTDDQILRTQRARINLEFDPDRLTATVEVGHFARLETRKARKDDCICSNESAYYPPLTDLKGFVPGVTIEGEVTARRLGTRWSIPDSRTAYLGTFEVDVADLQLAKNL